MEAVQKSDRGVVFRTGSGDWKARMTSRWAMGDVLGVRNAHEGATDLGRRVCEARNAWNVSTAADPSRQIYRGAVN